MEEVRLKGIVIKSSDYKDSDKMVTIFSAEKGIIKARARGVKKAKAKLSFAVQPFAFVDYLLVEKGGFYTIINASSIDQFYDVVTDFDKYIFGLASLELVSKTIKENDKNAEMFVLLIKMLKVLCYENVSPIIAFIKFMLESFKLLGYQLHLSDCVCCGEKLSNKIFPFSYDFNGMLCPKCSNKNEFLDLSHGKFAALYNIDITKFDSLGNLKILSRENLVSVINLLLRLFRIYVDEELESIKKFL